MGKNSWSPYWNGPRAIHDIKTMRVGFKRGAAPFCLRNPQKSLIPGTELFPAACALVEIIREYRTDLEPLFSQIIDQLSLPDIWEYIRKHIPFSDPLPQYLKKAIFDRKLGPYPSDYLLERSEDWRRFLQSNPQTVRVKELIDEYIVASLSPQRPIVVRRSHNGVMKEYTRKRNRRPVQPEKLPMFFKGILFHALAIVQDIDFYTLDDVILGHDYEIFTSPSKPTTIEDRHRKTELRRIVKNANGHVVEYSTFVNRAKLFYRSYFIADSCAEEAAEQEKLISNISKETWMFRIITGL